ncbi:PHD-zinc-finger like domain-containing protein [Thamnocephalis sphaerospora]|uniref:PHD-zinc-finger like domain-containing protein n=1 Tax=Thamnocephalis sphaerospora TaxID=78915 RepID=A0A4P9XW64_9FUNG|nr:PHD-zinc-finger like domain-containing protein [Thamnocephalis sphaerospora]|eukprot:RKP10565.1 PHD-zinc-finger like domain-containing protein [Thamnocephalis sphaerospora]
MSVGGRPISVSPRGRLVRPAWPRLDAHGGCAIPAELTESELDELVEYDMDEQDKLWLESINRDRSKEKVKQISMETFEFVMDRLEKEWFELVDPAQAGLPADDQPCNICLDAECDNTNAIVFCDGCNLAVHQGRLDRLRRCTDCYGIPYIPEGQWLCRKCMLSPEQAVSCIFCPNEGGAFKQTNYNKWAHLLCALWIPEVQVVNPVYMEPIEGVERIPKSRWKLSCSLCRERKGACIQCSSKHCFAAFHVTCARKAGLYMKMKGLLSVDDMRVYCSRHRPVRPTHRLFLYTCTIRRSVYLTVLSRHQPKPIALY